MAEQPAGGEGRRSTLDDVRGHDAGPRSLAGRRLGTVALGVAVLAGVLGLLGDRVVTETTSAEGYTLELEYPASSRPGLDVPWSLTVTSEGGFGEQVVVAVTGEYFRIYEHQGIDPAPAEETADDTWTYWTFTAPDGDTLSVDVDHYVQPASQVGATGTVAIVVDGRMVAPLEFSTTLWP